MIAIGSDHGGFKLKEEIKKYFDNLDFLNGYFQELGEHEEEYVPNFWFSLANSYIIV